MGALRDATTFRPRESQREFSAYWGAGLADDVAAVETLLRHDAVGRLTRLRLAELDPTVRYAPCPRAHGSPQ